MKTLIFLSLSVCILLFASFSKGESVLTLTSSNFDDTVNNADIILVEFYAPWCGHCKHLAPEYEAAAKILSAQSPPIPLGKVDATEEPALGERFEVRGYPTLKVFRKGKASDYSGPRDADGIVKYMEKQAGPSSKPLKSADEIDAFKKKGQGSCVVIGYFSDVNNPQLAKFRDTANQLREEFLFGEVTDKDLVKASNHENKVVVVRADGKDKVYDGTGNLADFVNANSIPIGGEYTQENAKRYASAKLPILKAFIPVDWAKNVLRTTYYQRRLQKLGEEFENKLLFALANKDTFLKDPSSYGLTDLASEFVVAIEDGAKKYVFPAAKAFNVENLRAFVNDFLGHKLSPFFKSEPVPEHQGPVTVVVGSTFDDIVLDDSKNVMIEFYAPWCGHCKTLAPIYEDLGKSFEDRKDVVIAKIDATANDFPRDKFEVQGFPTIYFKPAGAGSTVITYNGDRGLKDLEKFVKTHSTKSGKDEL